MPTSGTPTVTSPTAAGAKGNEKAVGHKRDVPAAKVVTAAGPSLAPPAPVVNPPAPPSLVGRRPSIDFAFLRKQVCLEQVLRHLGLFERMGDNAAVPVPSMDTPTTAPEPFPPTSAKTSSAVSMPAVPLLDLWAALKKLPLEAALDLATTFNLVRNREEEAVP